jgi:hypothetical protein
MRPIGALLNRGTRMIEYHCLYKNVRYPYINIEMFAQILRNMSNKQLSSPLHVEPVHALWLSVRKRTQARSKVT